MHGYIHVVRIPYLFASLTSDASIASSSDSFVRRCHQFGQNRDQRGLALHLHQRRQKRCRTFLVNVLCGVPHVTCFDCVIETGEPMQGIAEEEGRRSTAGRGPRIGTSFGASSLPLTLLSVPRYPASGSKARR